MHHKKHLFKLIGIALVIFMTVPCFAEGNFIQRQGKVSFIFNMLVLLLFIAVGGYIGWKKWKAKREED